MPAMIGNSEARLDRERTSHRVVDVAGEALWLLPHRAVWHPAARTLLLADAHLEKGSFFAAHGSPLPSYDTTDTLIRLSRLLATWQPETVVLLGDSFHDPNWEARLSPHDRNRLQGMIAATPRWIWAEGNHDRRSAIVLGGECCEAHTLGALACFHAMLSPPLPPSISGHWHPKVALSLKHAYLRAPCFLKSGDALVLPAFGAFTGGLDITDPAFTAVFGSRYDVYPIVEGSVYALPRGR